MASATRELEGLVRKHAVVWSVFPEKDAGYDLELNGVYAHPPHDPRPACLECRDVYDDLWSLAQFIIPKETPDGCAILPFDGKLSYSPRRGSKKEITLTIRVLDDARSASPREEDCASLMEMERRLDQLGARRE